VDRRRRPPGVMEGFTFKTTANALRGRKLITITKHADSWSAALTETGQHYLQHGVFPNMPGPGSSKSPRTIRSANTAPRPTPPARAAEVVDVGELVQRVRDHGGTLILSEALTVLTTTRRAAYRRAIHQINQERLAGPGFVLRHRGRDHGDLVIRLVAIGDGQPDESTEQMWAPEEV